MAAVIKSFWSAALAALVLQVLADIGSGNRGVESTLQKACGIQTVVEIIRKV